MPKTAVARTWMWTARSSVPEAHDVRSARVRAGGGHERAGDDERERRGTSARASHADPSGDSAVVAAGEVPGALHDDDGERERRRARAGSGP